MKEFKVTADITAHVEMIIKADTKEDARKIFDDQIMMTAGLSDSAEDRFDVMDDGISDIDWFTIQELDLVA